MGDDYKAFVRYNKHFKQQVLQELLDGDKRTESEQKHEKPKLNKQFICGQASVLSEFMSFRCWTTNKCFAALCFRNVMVQI